MDINIKDLKNLQHMLGVGEYSNERGYRNHFAPGGDDIKSMERLELQGFVRKGRPYENTFFYHATKQGCLLVGFNETEAQKILKGH